jgi:hypothetical protein
MTDEVDTRTEKRPRITPADVLNEFCHLFFDGDDTYYCGLPLKMWTGVHFDYDGQNICPVCGLPVCPRCKQIAAD